ncbi:MAG TPA: RNA 3'-terminal phosphate cyclase [Pyrinomonadaceae bacterium]|jgi:RNA 3'-terminal phosphate cyclase (ATP)|nr:RNA 3'-terminal phosphate cyclase [Pyrinomonadaceae bacterium]
MISIDGSYGEGGGQIIRTSLALSLITGKAFRAFNVRARRTKPGLQRQHLTAVTSAAAVGGAKVEGASVGAKEFTFVPGEVSPGEYRFSVGTAGSTMLVLQAVLPPLMIASAPSLLLFEGGTHNVHAPPFEFIQRTFLPLVGRMGPTVTVELQRYGFYPPGGGRFNVYVEPARELRRLDLVERGAVLARRARALCVNLPASIGERELAVVSEQLGWVPDQLDLETSDNAVSPGNVLTVEVESEHLTEVFTGMGQRGVRAEQVAAGVVHEVKRYMEVGAPVGEHLADQLLIPMALAGGGSYTTGPLTLHTTTNVEVIKKFLPVEIKTTHLAEDVWKVEVFA